jgi:hypothetical protein
MALLPVEVVGLTLPQDEPPQLTFHVTPAALLSFATAAVRLAVAFIASEAGGLEIVTEIGCMLVPPPHAASARYRSAVKQERTFLRNFIGSLPSLRSDSAEFE